MQGLAFKSWWQLFFILVFINTKNAYKVQNCFTLKKEKMGSQVDRYYTAYQTMFQLMNGLCLYNELYIVYVNI